MASTNSWSLELESQVDAPRHFRACALDWHTLAPKLAPHAIDSAHLVEGDGNIRQFNFTSAMPFNVVKEKLEFLDVDKCECKYTIECDGVEMATWNIKVKPTANGGSVANVECTYKQLPGKDEFLKAKDTITNMFKTADAYLITNPEAYN